MVRLLNNQRARHDRQHDQCNGLRSIQDRIESVAGRATTPAARASFPRSSETPSPGLTLAGELGSRQRVKAPGYVLVPIQLNEKSLTCRYHCARVSRHVPYISGG